MRQPDRATSKPGSFHQAADTGDGDFEAIYTGTSTIKSIYSVPFNTLTEVWNPCKSIKVIEKDRILHSLDSDFIGGDR